MTDAKKEKLTDRIERFRQGHPTLYFFTDLFLNIAVIIVLVYTVRTYLISPFQVFGPSMCDTLNSINQRCQDGFGEYLIVNKAVYYPFFGHRFGMPERGDIIVFRPPENPRDFYIKRIIGLPGEKVKIQNGKVYVYNKEHQSGIELMEPYLNKNNKNQTFCPSARQKVFTYEVPEGEYFVLGDNRQQSTDSRTGFKTQSQSDCKSSPDHFLALERIEGKAWVVLWPFNKIRHLENSAYNM